MPAYALFGSGEFLPWARPVDAWCVERSSNGSDRVLVVPTASAPEGEETFLRWGRMGMAHYRALGLTPEVLPLRTRTDASDPALVDAIAGARLVYLSGGNPGYLVDTLAATPFRDALADAVANGTAIGGCSAGAFAFGALAPHVDGTGPPARWVDGLRLLPRAYVVPHFDALDGYLPGLRQMMLDRCPPGCIAIGIDENTALYGDGERWRVAGQGAVWIVEDHAPRDHRDGDEVVLRLTGPVG